MATGIDSTTLTSSSALPGRADEAVLDVEHDLARDQQVVVERQGVLGEVDDALDRVLDRHDAAVDLAGGDGVEHVGHGRVGDELAAGEVGLGAQRLLGERAERPEEPDPQRRLGRRWHGLVGRPWPGRLLAPPTRAPGDSTEGSGSMGAVDEPALRALLDDLAAGRVDADEAVRRLHRLPFADLGDALVDHHRDAAPGHAGGRVRPGQDARAVRAHRRRAARPRHRRRCC